MPEPVIEDKVTFDERQQAKINELIQEAQGRAAREVRAERDALKASVEAAAVELAAAKADLAKAKTPAEKKEGKVEVEALQAQIAEMKLASESTKAEAERLRLAAEAKAKEATDARGEITRYQRDSALRDAAVKTGFFDPADVIQTAASNVQWDSEKKRFVVIGDSGQMRLNAAYEPMSLDEYCQELAGKKPYMVRGDVKGGVGSKPSEQRNLSSDGKFELTDLFGPKLDGKKVHTLVATKGMVEYRRLKALAKESGLIL